MKNKNSLLPQDLYNAHLKEVNSIKFTRREIDTIAYLLSGKSAKTIATSLGVSPKTVESHVHNIMAKIESNSRDGIINFIEQSDKVEALKTYYQSLLIEGAFRKQVELLSKQISKNALKFSVHLVCWNDSDTKTTLICSLVDHLKQVGVQVSVEQREIFDPQGHQGSSKDINLFYCSEALIKKLGTPKKDERFSQFIEEIKKMSEAIVILFPHKNFAPEVYESFEGVKSINFEEEMDYYGGVFGILKEIFPGLSVEESLAELKKQAQLISGSSFREKSFDILTFSSTHWIKQTLSWILLQKRKFLYGGASIGIVGIVIFYLFISYVGRGVNVPAIRFQEGVLRSDLILPTDSVLLNRPQLIKTIEEALKTSAQNVGTNGIKTIALVGIGGSGKTTLARYYARQQKASVVAEVDAETKEGLSESFESLAKILSITEEDKKNLRKIQDIEFVKERDKQILLFVKEKLKKSPNWLLIYDNVKHFKDIHEYFPYDSGAWGNGRIIVITRDKNIQNNSYISSIIEVTELTPQEKLDLFIKIMESGMLEKYPSHQREQANSFLKVIPPFPLDVSIAAYYLKMTKVPYEKYLEHIKTHHQDFAAIQENVIKEASDYTKTRYGIITLSLDNIIQTDPDFASLLLFISLLNDQNIPRDLLNAYKNDIIVDNFIYHLKKYSLITRESTSPSLASPLFSIHPSTQEVSLDYLQKKLDLKNNREVLNGIVTTMENYIDKAINQEDTLKMKFLAPHMERMLRQPLMDLHMRETLQAKLGHIYYYLNEYTKAKDLLERTLHELREQNSNKYEEIAETLMYLGDVYSVLSNYEQARRLSEESLEIYQKYLSKNYLGTAKALTYLGNVYRRLGNYEKAKELCQQSLELYKQYDSKNSIEFAWTLAHLGQAYKELGNYDKARDLLEESLKIYKEKSPDNCLREAWILAHIGSVYRKLGDFEKAKIFLKLSLDIYRKYFSENHARTAWVLLLLGEVYKDLKDYDVAESYFVKSLAIYEQNYGKDHQENTKVLAKLGEIYFLKGKVDQGEELLNRAFDISLKAQHPRSFLSLEILADLYFTKSSQVLKRGQDKEAQLLKKKAFDYLNQARHIMKKCSSEESSQLERIDKKLKDFQSFIKE